jgi:hypothetical protein
MYLKGQADRAASSRLPDMISPLQTFCPETRMTEVGLHQAERLPHGVLVLNRESTISRMELAVSSRRTLGN